MGLEFLVKLSLKNERIRFSSCRAKYWKTILVDRGKNLQTRLPAMHIEGTCLTKLWFEFEWHIRSEQQMSNSEPSSIDMGLEGSERMFKNWVHSGSL